jgi:hypothetical protein
LSISHADFLIRSGHLRTAFAAFWRQRLSPAQNRWPSVKVPASVSPVSDGTFASLVRRMYNDGRYRLFDIGLCERDGSDSRDRRLLPLWPLD